MANRIPTEIGDVLILCTDQSFNVYAIGKVTDDGQQDFHDLAKAKYASDKAVAVSLARIMVAPGRRIYLHDIDTGGWSEVPDQ